MELRRAQTVLAKKKYSVLRLGWTKAGNKTRLALFYSLKLSFPAQGLSGRKKSI